MSSEIAKTVRLVLAAGLICACHAPFNTRGGLPPVNTLTAREQQEGWRLLFDGRTTAGWRGYKKQSVPPGWKVVNGSLVRAAADAGDIITTEVFRNFRLALDWKVGDGGNSGIFYRATEEGDYVWQSASEMQVLDDAQHADGKSPLTSAGSNFALYPAPRGAVRPAGEWNSPSSL